MSDSFTHRLHTKPVDLLFRKTDWTFDAAEQEVRSRGLYRGVRRGQDQDHHTFALAREHELEKPNLHGAKYTVHPYHLADGVLVRCVSWIEPRIRGRGRKKMVSQEAQRSSGTSP